MKKIFLSLIFAITLFVFQSKQINSQTIGWQQLSFVPTYPLYGVYCINYDTVIAVGANGYIIRTFDSGEHWDPIASNTTNDLYRIHFVNQTTGYAVGEKGTILKTNDMGQTWENISIPTNLNFFSLSFINKDTGWVAGGEGDLYYTSGNKGILLKTTNGGTNWLVDSSYNKTLSSVYFINNDTGYVTANYSSILGGIDTAIIFKTNNGGNSFFTIKQDSFIPIGFYTDIHFINAKTGFFVNSSADFDYGTSGIYKTTDFGNTWNKVLTQWSVKTLYVLDSCILYLSYSDMPGDGSIGKNTCTSDSFSGPGHRIFDFSFINIDSGFAVGNLGCYNSCNGVIYKRDLLENINEKKQEIEIFPNPFNDIIIVDFCNTNIDISKINLMVYNSMGQKILDRPELKNNQIIINLSDKPNGLYYLIINDNNKIIQTKKIIKL